MSPASSLPPVMIRIGRLTVYDFLVKLRVKIISPHVHFYTKEDVKLIRFSDSYGRIGRVKVSPFQSSTSFLLCLLD
jgi:hypothetical protein